MQVTMTLMRGKVCSKENREKFGEMLLTATLEEKKEPLRERENKRNYSRSCNNGTSQKWMTVKQKTNEQQDAQRKTATTQSKRERQRKQSVITTFRKDRRS